MRPIRSAALLLIAVICSVICAGQTVFNPPGSTPPPASSYPFLAYYGPWNASIEYPAGATVGYGGGTYIAIAANSAITPGSDGGATWTTLSSSGVTLGGDVLGPANNNLISSIQAVPLSGKGVVYFGVGAIPRSAVAGDLVSLLGATPVALASALAGTPALCSSGQVAQGILANGNATGCAAVLTIASQSPNLFYAGPSSGGAANPTFRALVLGDLPSGIAASTANSLAVTPTLCSAGSAPTGILPSGNATGCAAIPTALPPNGAASGDLSGSFPSPNVAKLNGVALSGLATGLLKNTTGSGAPSIAVSGTDYAPATSGSALLKANGSGGFSAATIGDVPTGYPYGNLTGSPAALPPNGAASGDLGGTYPSPTVTQAAALKNTAAGTLRAATAIAGPSNWQTLDSVTLPWIGLSLNAGSFDYTKSCLSGSCWPFATAAFALELPSSAASASSSPGYAAVQTYARANTAFNSGASGAAVALRRGETFTTVNGAGTWGDTLQLVCGDRDPLNASFVSFFCAYLENEIDVVNDSASSTHVHGWHIVGNQTATASDDSALKIESLTGTAPRNSLPYVPWAQAINIVAGSASVGIVRGPINAAVSNASIPDQYCGEDSGGSVRCAQVAADQNGAPALIAANNGATTAALTVGKTAVGNLLTVDHGGAVAASGPIDSNTGYTARSDGSSATYTAAQVRDAIIDETATAASLTFTLPTAASLISQITAKGGLCFTSSTSVSIIRNVGTNSFTIQGNTGLTLSTSTGASTLTVGPGQQVNLLNVVSSCGSNTVSTFGGVSSSAAPYSSPAHQFLTALSSTGAFTSAQPGFGDISGTIASSQFSTAQVLPGSLGLGGVTPTYYLHVAPTSGVTPNQTALFEDNTPTTGSTSIVWRYGPGQTNGSHVWSIQNSTGGSELGWIDSNVGNPIFHFPGYSSPSGNSYFTDSGVSIVGTAKVAWGPSSVYSLDTAIARNTVASIEVNNATAGVFATLRTGAILTYGDSTVLQLAAPTGVTVTPQGGGSANTSYSYTVVAKGTNGSTLASSVATTATGNTTLNGTTFNKITWNSTPGAVYYDIYRTASAGTPSTTGKIVTSQTQGAGATQTYNDQGAAGDATTSPTANTTGNFTVPGQLNRTIGTAVASATTIVPSGPIFHVTGTTTIQTMTPPTGMTSGCVQMIPDGLWSTNTSGNFALGTTAVVSKMLTACYDAGAAKWYPSY